MFWKKFLKLLFFLSIFSISCFAQSSFEFGYNTDEDELPFAACIDHAGKYLIAGMIGPLTGGNIDALIIRVHPDGEFEVTRFDRQDTVSLFNSIITINNGDYFVTGCFSNNGNNYKRDKLWVCILDSTLNIKIEKSYLINNLYPEGFTSVGSSMIDNDGNIVLATAVGYKVPPNPTTFTDLALFKFTPDGDTLVSRYIYGIYSELPFELRQMPCSDNIMLICWGINPNNHNELMFLDKNLNLLFCNDFGNSNSVSASISCSSQYWYDNYSFLMSTDASWDRKNGKNESYLNVLLVDTSATILKELILNKPDTVDYTARQQSMAYVNDSTIYIAGFQEIIDFWSTQPTIVELYMIDKDMNLLGYKNLGGDSNYDLWGILPSDDGGCLLYADSYDNPTGEPERDIHIWKVLRDEINIVTSVEEAADPPAEAPLWPNPALNEICIGLPSSANSHPVNVQLFNAQGRKVLDHRLSGCGNVIRIELKNLNSGSYIYKLFSEGKLIQQGDFIKQ